MNRKLLFVVIFLAGYLIGGAVVNVGCAAEPENPPPTYPSVTPAELQKFLALPKYQRPLWVRMLTEQSGCRYSLRSLAGNVCWDWL